jgi:RNA-directed DNA polymerase
MGVKGVRCPNQNEGTTERKDFFAMGKSFEITQHQVLDAYKRVKANKGAEGVDGMTFLEYEKNLKNNLYKLWNRMASGSYFPKAVRGVEIPKKNGKSRLLGIPTIEDRVGQMVVKMELEPEVDQIFYEDSYGYRPGKSALDAVGVVRERCFRYAWLIEFDIVGLFDNIDHEMLMRVVERHSEKKWVRLYIKRWLTAAMVMPNGETVERTKGTPQGGVASPILANLFMHYVFDRWMSEKYPQNPWARYADDGVIHCRSKEEAEDMVRLLSERLERCKLMLHPEKTRIVYCRNEKRKGKHEHEKFVFLGYEFRPRYVKARNGEFFLTFSPAVSPEAAKQLRRRCRELAKGCQHLSISYLAELLNPVIRGWMQYFSVYGKSACRQAVDYANLMLVRWVRKKYKRAKRQTMWSWKLLANLEKSQPSLFYHWQAGVRPTIATAGAV